MVTKYKSELLRVGIVPLTVLFCKKKAFIVGYLAELTSHLVLIWS